MLPPNRNGLDYYPAPEVPVMLSIKEAARAAFVSSAKFVKYLPGVLAGRNVIPPSLGAMTLDRDDVAIAHQSLRDRKNWFDTETVEQYHKRFQDWNQSSHAWSFMGGRVALSACLAGLDLQPGDEVIIPGFTCIVVPNAIRFAGLTPVYADIELETYGLDLAATRAKVTPRTRAIVVQHLFGLVSRDFEAILDLARNAGIKVIEDCAHATGARFKGIPVGNFGDVAFYSSETSKMFNTVQGGVAVTNNPEIAAKIQAYYDKVPFADEHRVARQLKSLIYNYHVFKAPNRWFAANWNGCRYRSCRTISTTEEEIAGRQPVNYHQKMPAAVARIGINQLAKLDSYIARRRDSAQHWNQWCRDKGYALPSVIDQSEPVFLRYPVMVDPARKADLTWAWETLGVRPGVWFVSHAHPAPVEVADCPNAKLAIECCINMPTLDRVGQSL